MAAYIPDFTSPKWNVCLHVCTGCLLTKLLGGSCIRRPTSNIQEGLYYLTLNYWVLPGTENESGWFPFPCHIHGLHCHPIQKTKFIKIHKRVMEPRLRTRLMLSSLPKQSRSTLPRCHSLDVVLLRLWQLKEKTRRKGKNACAALKPCSWEQPANPFIPLFITNWRTYSSWSSRDLRLFSLIRLLLNHPF